MALPSIDDKPVARLFNVPKLAGAIGVDFSVINKDPAVMGQVKNLYPNARKMIADSDHEIQTGRPGKTAHKYGCTGLRAG